MLASSAAVNSVRAKAVGHMAPSSRFASSLKPSVAYLVLNFCLVWKKQTTLPSLAYAGIPYQSLGERAGALALMMAWSRSPMARSGSGISSIFASTALSPSALSARGPQRADALSSWMRSFIATRSSAVNPLNFLLIDVVFLADFCVSFLGLMEVPDWESSSVQPVSPGKAVPTARSGARRRGLQAEPEEVRQPPQHAGGRRPAPHCRTIAHRGVRNERRGEGDGEAGVGKFMEPGR